VPDEHRVRAAAVDVRQESLVARSRLAGVRRKVVVAVVTDDRPAEALGELKAVGSLPLDAEAGTLAVLADPGVENDAAAQVRSVSVDTLPWRSPRPCWPPTGPCLPARCRAGS